MKRLITLLLGLLVILGAPQGLVAEEDFTPKMTKIEDVLYLQSDLSTFQKTMSFVGTSIDAKSPDFEDMKTAIVTFMNDEQPEQIVVVNLTTVTEDFGGSVRIVDLPNLPTHGELEDNDSGADLGEGSDIFETNDFVIAITDYEILAPGEGANQYGQDPVIRFISDIHIPEGKDSNSALFIWSTSTRVIQDNDPNKVNVLDPAVLLDGGAKDGLAEIKPGGTVSYATSYTLTDLETPVTLEFKSNLFSSEPDKVISFPMK